MTKDKIKINNEEFSISILKNVMKMSQKEIDVLKKADTYGWIDKDFMDLFKLNIKNSLECLRRGIDPGNKSSF